MKCILTIEVEFDPKAWGVDSVCDAEHVATRMALHELEKDEDEDPKVTFHFPKEGK